MKLNAKLLWVQQKIKKEKAIERVYREQGPPEVHDHVKVVDNVEKKDHKKSTSNKRNDAIKTSNSDVQLAMIDMMKLQCAPLPDIDVFSGDPLEYFYFKAIFKEVIEVAVPTQLG